MEDASEEDKNNYNDARTWQMPSLVGPQVQPQFVPVNIFPNQHSAIPFGVYGDYQQQPSNQTGRHSAPTVPGYSGHYLNLSATQENNRNSSVQESLAAMPEEPKKKKAVSKSKKTVTAKSKAAGKDYTKKETTMLLDCMEKYKPIGSIEWNSVVDCFNSKLEEGRPERDAPSIRRKYTSLYVKKAPTGDPNIPEPVLRAKAIQKEIENKSEMIDAEDMTEGSEEAGPVEGGDESSGAAGAQTNSTTPSAAARKDQSKSSTSSSKRGRSKKGKKKSEKSETSEILEAFIMTEKMSAKREEKREKARDKRDKRNMKMMLSMMATAVNVLASKKGNKKHGSRPVIDLEKVIGSSSSSSSSSDSSLSPYDSDDSPPVKRLKLDRMEKRNAK